MKLKLQKWLEEVGKILCHTVQQCYEANYDFIWHVAAENGKIRVTIRVSSWCTCSCQIHFRVSKLSLYEGSLYPKNIIYDNQNLFNLAVIPRRTKCQFKDPSSLITSTWLAALIIGYGNSSSFFPVLKKTTDLLYTRGVTQTANGSVLITGWVNYPRRMIISK